MNDDSNILDDRSALMLYLADELPMALRHEMETRLANEPDLARQLEELRTLEREVHLIMDAPLADARGEALVRGTMAAIRRQAMAPAAAGAHGGEIPADVQKRRRIAVIGYVAFAAAACVVLALGLWTLGLFGVGENRSKPNNVGQNAVVDMDESFFIPADPLTPRLNEASEHLRALQENPTDDSLLMMM